MNTDHLRVQDPIKCHVHKTWDGYTTTLSMGTHSWLFGYEIKWTTWIGEKCSVSVPCEFKSKSIAIQVCIAQAIRLGWTPPRWWQWWRRHDTRVR